LAGLHEAGKKVEQQRGRVEQLADSLGVSSSLLARGQSVAVLERLPLEARTMYRDMPAKYKRIIVQKLHETSGFLFLQVSHRDAFIQGAVGGTNVFDYMEQELQSKMASGTVDRTTAGVISQTIEAFRHMSAHQRAAVVSLLEADVASR
jgi:hypothetical protein